ncbi:MAG: signal recognition particle-docking protein FtsY [bacterium]
MENIEEEPEEKPKKIGLFQKIKQGLTKTRDNILNGVEQALASFTKIDEELFEELEEVLICADIGIETSMFIMEEVRKIVKLEKVQEVSEIKNIIARVISQILESDNYEFELNSPSVLLIIGVNGVGKTTTIGKLSSNYKSEGKSVLLAAADTFRAAAIDQLQVWGDRSGIDVIKHQENSDPAAVVFDAIQASKARDVDLLICDTAGRLHNKKNLMQELEKISRVIYREHPEAQVETLLVLDATTGQNALQQAKLFSEVANITGIVLTKLDGTAKGGVIIAIKNELKIPVRFIGVGEGIEDLKEFDAIEFSKALFDD